MSVVLCQTKFMQMFISADTWIMMLDGDQWEAHLHTLLSQFLNKITNEHSPDWAGPYSQFLHVLFCLCRVSLHFSPVCSWLHSNNYAIQIIMMKVLNVFIITRENIPAVTALTQLSQVNSWDLPGVFHFTANHTFVDLHFSSSNN